MNWFTQRNAQTSLGSEKAASSEVWLNKPVSHKVLKNHKVSVNAVSWVGVLKSPSVVKGHSDRDSMLTTGCVPGKKYNTLHR